MATASLPAGDSTVRRVDALSENTLGDASLEALIEGAVREASALSWVSPQSREGEGVGAASASQLSALSAPTFPGFQVLKTMSSGGQAVVYLGVEESTEREVAIKAFRTLGVSTAKNRYRFEREVEALQGLRHPNIVHILRADADSNPPYLVMEFVPGWNLDDYMREHDLDVRGTVRMFRTIALAVQAAHQRGVIHRDIKPSNIRVDRNAEPHVFDFGLAKMTDDPAVTGGSAFAGAESITQPGQFLGTLHWASPEQAEGRLQDVDIRTDVYSLGLVLHYMLTGRMPYEVTGSMREVLNRIVTVEPSRPSQHRGEVDDDVDTVVLKCLSKDRTRRYESARALADDLGLWLEGRAIQAKRDSWTYVASKFVTRHRWPVSVAVLTMAAAIVVGNVTTQHRNEIARFRDANEQAFLHMSSTTSAAATVAEFRRLAIEEAPDDKVAVALDNALKALDAVPDDPTGAAIVQRVAVAMACHDRGQSEDANKQIQRALGQAEEKFGAGSKAALMVMIDVPALMMEAGDAQGAKAMALRAISLAKRHYPTDFEKLVDIQRTLIWVTLKGTREYEPAHDQVRELVRLARQAFAPPDFQRSANLKFSGEMLYDIGLEYRQNGLDGEPWFQESLGYRREALALIRTHFKQDVRVTADHLHSISVHLRETGQLDEAEQLATEALSLRRTLDDPRFPNDSMFVCASEGNLGVIKMYKGDFATAHELLIDALKNLSIGQQREVANLRAGFSARLAELHEQWELVEPNQGHAEYAAQWRAAAEK